MLLGGEVQVFKWDSLVHCHIMFHKKPLQGVLFMKAFLIHFGVIPDFLYTSTSVVYSSNTAPVFISMRCTLVPFGFGTGPGVVALCTTSYRIFKGVTYRIICTIYAIIMRVCIFFLTVHTWLTSNVIEVCFCEFKRYSFLSRAPA